MRSGLTLLLGLTLLCPPHALAQDRADSPRRKAFMATSLDEEITQLRYINCLADEAERVGGTPQDLTAVAQKIHGRCPAQGVAYWAAHERLRQVSGIPAVEEDKSGVTFELNGALYGVMHRRIDEAETRRFNAQLEVRLRTGIAFGKCMHEAALKVDDHASKPAEIAPKIVDACLQEEQLDTEASVKGEPADVAAQFRADQSVNRLKRAERDVELAREQPHYYDGD